MSDAAARILNAAVNAVRLTVAEDLRTRFLQASADACRHTICLIRSMLHAQELRTHLAALGASVGSGVTVYTHADLVRAATDAVAAGFLTPDDPCLAGIPLG